jgi:serine protease
VAIADHPTNFFTASAADCVLFKSWPDWVYEGIAFYARVPDGQGACGADTAAVHRLYNNGRGGAPNHAYTADPAKRDTLVAAGWVSEGVAFCVPLAAGDSAAMTQLLAGSRWQFTDPNTWLLETRFDPAPTANANAQFAKELIASWGFPKPPEAIYHQPNDLRPFGPGDGSWDGVGAWDPLSGEYLVLSLDNFDGYRVAWTFDSAQGMSRPLCAMYLVENFEIGSGLHPFQPALASGCTPGVAYRLTP